MAAIITEKFRLHNASQFVESFTEASANVYYLFLGKSSPFSSATSGGSDSSPPTPADAVGQTEYYSWDSMLGAKKIASSDVTRAVVRRNFANGTTYDMYEHNISSDNTTTSGASNLYLSLIHISEPTRRS